MIEEANSRRLLFAGGLLECAETRVLEFKSPRAYQFFQ
jgi:hypothetical protein